MRDDEAFREWVHPFEAFQELTELVATDGKRVVAFLGSGMSGTDYVSWKNLVCQLVSRCEVVLDSDDRELLCKGDAAALLRLAGRAKSEDGPEYWRALAEEFGRPTSDSRSWARYQLLMALGLQAYVTTNFDPLLLKQFQLCAGSRYGEDIRVPPAQGTLGADGSAFVYLHGGYDAHEEGRHRLLGNLVLTSDDFDEEYSPTGSAGLFVRDLMRANNVVFLGCELRERGLSDALEAARDIRHAQKARGIDAGYELRDHKRVILLPSNVPMAAWQQPLDQPDPARYFAHSELQGEGSGKTPAEVRLRMDELHAEQKRDAELDTDCGIRVVRYDNTQGDYAVLWRTLWHWTQRERPSVTLQGMSPLPGSEDRGDEPHG